MRQLSVKGVESDRSVCTSLQGVGTQNDDLFGGTHSLARPFNVRGPNVVGSRHSVGAGFTSCRFISQPRTSRAASFPALG